MPTTTRAGGTQGSDERPTLNKKGCCQTGLNCRPLHYQWSALPLSYGSMPLRESAKKAPTRRPILATRPLRAQARGTGPRRRRKPPKSVLDGRGLLQLAQLRANPVPHLLAQRVQRLDGSDHALRFHHSPALLRVDDINTI